MIGATDPTAAAGARQGHDPALSFNVGASDDDLGLRVGQGFAGSALGGAEVGAGEGLPEQESGRAEGEVIVAVRRDCTDLPEPAVDALRDHPIVADARRSPDHSLGRWVDQSDGVKDSQVRLGYLSAKQIAPVDATGRMRALQEHTDPLAAPTLDRDLDPVRAHQGADDVPLTVLDLVGLTRDRRRRQSQPQK